MGKSRLFIFILLLLFSVVGCSSDKEVSNEEQSHDGHSHTSADEKELHENMEKTLEKMQFGECETTKFDGKYIDICKQESRFKNIEELNTLLPNLPAINPFQDYKIEDIYIFVQEREKLDNLKSINSWSNLDVFTLNFSKEDKYFLVVRFVHNDTPTYENVEIKTVEFNNKNYKVIKTKDSEILEVMTNANVNGKAYNVSFASYEENSNNEKSPYLLEKELIELLDERLTDMVK